MANASIKAAFERMWQHTTSAINNAREILVYTSREEFPVEESLEARNNTLYFDLTERALYLYTSEPNSNGTAYGYCLVASKDIDLSQAFLTHNGYSNRVLKLRKVDPRHANQLLEGELGYSLDTNRLFIGNGTGNTPKEIAMVDHTHQISDIEGLEETLATPTTYYANTSPASSEYSFATVFSNGYLNTMTGKVYKPKNGDALLVPEMNAIYKYIHHETTTNQLRVYAYQAFRDNTNVASAESVANLVGNFTCTYSDTHTDGKYHYAGDLADCSLTDEIANTGNPYIYTLGKRGEFNEYMRANENGENKKTPLIFKDSPFRLVASYTIPWNEGDSPSDLAKTYLAEHIDEFPLAQLTQETGGTADGIIYVIEADDVTFSQDYEWICSKFIDSALALEAYSPSLRSREILFEFWNGGCIFAGGNTNYIVSQMGDLLNSAKDNTLTWYWADEGGRENFELRLEVAGAENPKNYDGAGSIKNITQLTNSTRRLVTKVGAASDKGYWVYDQPISMNAYNRAIDIINVEPKSYSNTGDGAVYTYDCLVENCKTGDIAIRIPQDGSFIKNIQLVPLNVTMDVSAWECQTSRPGKSRQVWKKLL